MKVIYDDTCAMCNGFRTWVEQRTPEKDLEFVGLSEQPTGTIPLSLELLESDGTRLLGVSAVLTTVGHTKGLLGTIARLLNRKPVHLLLTPTYRLIAANRARKFNISWLSWKKLLHWTSSR